MSEKERELGEKYWEVIEPVWDAISIYDEPETFLKQFQNVSHAQGHLFATHWCQSEVCNGGFYQFFWNSTGVLAPEAIAGFLVIGLPDCAAIVQDAMACFGSGNPRERSERIALLDQLVHGEIAEEELFKELDDKFFIAIGDNSKRFAHAADTYAREIAS